MRVLLIAFILLNAIACNKRDRKEAVILPKDKMEKVIWDMMVVDEYVNVHVSKDTLKDLNQERLKLYQKVFRLHHISRADFNASLKHYSTKPDVMKVIFDSLSSKGELQRRKLIPLK